MSDIKIGYIDKITPEECRDKAETILKDAGFWSNKIPVKIELLANSLGYNVNTLQGLREHLDSKGLVLFNVEPKKFEIIIDDYHYNNDTESYQFTLAEEISHIILHSKLFQQIKTLDDRLKLDEDITESTHRYIEKQAKSLASELLLPSNKFYPFATDWIKNNLEIIVNEKPSDQDDFASIIARKLKNDLGLSEFIIKRALLREVNPLFLLELKNIFKIKYLSEVPSNSINSIQQKKN